MKSGIQFIGTDLTMNNNKRCYLDKYCEFVNNMSPEKIFWKSYYFENNFQT